MTPREQRIAIAEACGWSRNKGASDGLDVYEGWNDPSGRFRFDCPDYLNDLNAMHEAEKMLEGFQSHIYAERLCSILNVSLINGERPKHVGAPWLSWTGVFQVSSATAAQRAEAFCAVIKAGLKKGAGE